MALRPTRWLLWLVFCLTLPLPYFVIESGRIPAVQLLLFSALTAPLIFTDPGLTTNVIGVLFTVQTLLYGALLYVAARVVAARLPPARRGAMLCGIAVALALLALTDVYVAPLSRGSGPTNWLGLWP